MNKLTRSHGSILLTVLIVMFVLAIGVAALMQFAGTGITQVKATTHSMKAFYIAEAGLQVGIKRMADDFKYTPEGQTPSWSDNVLYTPTGSITIPGDGAPQQYPNFTTIIPETVYNEGTYEVSIAAVPGSPRKVWVRSQGIYQGMSRTVMSQLGIKNISPWNNAIFAGEGAAGKTINGNVDIRGSVHLLGTSLDDSDPAIEIDYTIFMSGAGNIGNNYLNMPSALFERVPSILKPFLGGMAEDLETNVRIKNGRLDLSGSAQVGQDQESIGNGYKGPVEGVFVTDGFGGNQGEDNIYSDNGTGNPYDCGDQITFPRLTEPHQSYPSYIEYIRANALVIDDPASLSALANIDPETTFSASNANGTLILDGNGNMTVDGIVLIDGPVAFSGKTHDVIKYTGKASILATGDITFEVDMLSKWFDTYPDEDIVAFMTPGDITFNKSQLNIMGLFYAEDTITSQKQTNVAGTFFANYFDMGTNVPSIYQVPETANNLPPGLIGAENMYVLTQDIWVER